MELNNCDKRYFILAGVLLVFAVFLDAAGAHIVAARSNAALVGVYQTGARYHIYYSILLLVTTIIGIQLNLNFKYTRIFHVIGIGLFSFGCYIYALTEVALVKKFIPFGGISFAIGWIFFIVTVIRKK